MPLAAPRRPARSRASAGSAAGLLARPRCCSAARRSAVSADGSSRPIAPLPSALHRRRGRRRRRRRSATRARFGRGAGARRRTPRPACSASSTRRWHEGGWFGSAHEAAGARGAPATADIDERLRGGAHAARRGDPAGHARRRRGRARAGARAHAIRTPTRQETRRLMDVRFLGHACLRRSATATRPCSIDPFLTGNPKAAATADEVARRRDPAHPRPRRPPRRHRRDRQAHRRAGGGDRRARRRARASEGVETSPTRTIGGTVEFDWGWVKLVPGLAHVDLAEGHGDTPRPAC